MPRSTPPTVFARGNINAIRVPANTQPTTPTTTTVTIVPAATTEQTIGGEERMNVDDHDETGDEEDGEVEEGEDIDGRGAEGAIIRVVIGTAASDNDEGDEDGSSNDGDGDSESE